MHLRAVADRSPNKGASRDALLSLLQVYRRSCTHVWMDCTFYFYKCMLGIAHNQRDAHTPCFSEPVRWHPEQPLLANPMSPRWPLCLFVKEHLVEVACFSSRALTWATRVPTRELPNFFLSNNSVSKLQVHSLCLVWVSE